MSQNARVDDFIFELRSTSIGCHGCEKFGEIALIDFDLVVSWDGISYN